VTGQILDVLEHCDGSQAVGVAALLVEGGDTAENLLSILYNALTAEELRLRVEAAVTLARANRWNKHVIDALFEALQNRDAVPQPYAALVSLIPLAASDPDVSTRLLSWLSATKPGLSRLLSIRDPDISDDFIETLATMMIPGFSAVRSRWRTSVTSRIVDSLEDAEALSDMVSTSSADDDNTRVIRELLFTRMWRGYGGRESHN